MNSVYVWFKNGGNSTILNANAKIILDTTPPTITKPDVEIVNDFSFRITCKQKDPEVGSGLKKIQIGYKEADASEYIWQDAPSVTNPTIEVKNNKPNKQYMIMTRAEDNCRTCK